MANFDTKRIRNIVLLGHGGCGKTSLAEAMAYITGGTDRLGKIEDGNTISDFDAEETKRGFSLSTSMHSMSSSLTFINTYIHCHTERGKKAVTLQLLTVALTYIHYHV